MICRYCDNLAPHRHRWWTFFGDTAYGPGVWNDRRQIGRSVTGGPAAADDPDSTDDWSAYADGGQKSRTFSFGADLVYGWAALRLLCHLNDLQAPARRMNGEPFRPDPGLLTLAVARQLAEGRAPRPGAPSWREFDPDRPFDHLSGAARAFWVDLHRIHHEYGIDPGVEATVTSEGSSQPLDGHLPQWPIAES